MHKYSILIIDSNEHQRAVRAACLIGAGYHVFEASTLAQSEDLLRQSCPDLIIVANRLPDLDGILLYSAVQSICPAAMALLLTDAPVASVPKGIVRVLNEPVPPKAVLSEIQHLVPRSSNAQASPDRMDAQSQLVIATRQAAIGELVAQIAHELNNPLAIILGSAELLPPQQSEEDQLLVQQIIDSTRRAGQVMQSLAIFARDHASRKSWCDPNRLIMHVLTLRQWAFGERGITLKTTIDPALPSIWADEQHFQQMLINVLMNAETALSRARVPHLSVSVSANMLNQTLMIEIADNGPGIDPILQERIFDPLVTTERHRLGMGLTIARAIVADHHGTIEATSVVGRGATFCITLPIRKPASDETSVYY